MCRCKYPKTIKKNEITILEDDKGERCYKISFNLEKEGSNLLVVSRAPKGAEENSCNSLYKRIIKYLDGNKEEFNGIKTLTIVNLFAMYEYEKGDLYEECLLKGTEYVEGNENNYNDKVIAEEIEKADYIIAAWGEPLEGLEQIYVNRVELVLKSIRFDVMKSTSRKKVLRVGEASKRGYPKHCFAWSYHDKLYDLFE